MTKIDTTKPLQTRDGREVRVYSEEGVAPYVMHGAIKTPNGWELCIWDVSGRYFTSSKCESKNDLIPRKTVVWVNVYEDKGVFLHSSHDEAIANRTFHRGRCAIAVRVELE
jgi:hypothetical protein